MSLGRYFPNTRETADETKRRVWRDHGMLVVNPDDLTEPWDVKLTLKQIGEKLYGPRRRQGDTADAE